MQHYKEFRPTEFDRHIEIDNDETREDWLVLPTGRNRDSGNLENVNFDAALAGLGGEGDNVEVHRFGHWGPGWFEIIIVRPDTPEHEKALDIEASLDNYPVLDEEELSEIEYDDYLTAWLDYGCSDYVKGLAEAFELSDEAEYFLDDIDHDKMREHYESSLNSPYESNSDCCRLFIDESIEDCHSIDDLMAPYFNDLKEQLRSVSLRTGTPDIMSPIFWDEKDLTTLEELEEMLKTIV